MNWNCRQEDEKGWDGKRKFLSHDFEQHEDARLVIIPRLGGMDAVERRVVELNDVCAEHPTPWKQLVLQRGKPGKELHEALVKLCDKWNKLDEDKGLKWRVAIFGLDVFKGICGGFVKGEQPEVWIHLEFLSDRLLAENQEFDRIQKEKAKLAKEGGSDPLPAKVA